MTRFMPHNESLALRKNLSWKEMNFLNIGIKFYNEISMKSKNLNAKISYNKMNEWMFSKIIILYTNL